MKILYHLPNPNGIYAARTIYYGYKHAFEDLGDEFRALTPNEDQKEVFNNYQPDLFFTSISPLAFKYLDLDLIKRQRVRGLKVAVATPFWKSPFSRFRINEVPSLSTNKGWVNLIRSGNFGDIYHNICEQNDPRMDGFKKITGFNIHTILLAADQTTMFPEIDNNFLSDISYIGTYLPGKKKILDEQVIPLMKKYKVKIYGQDWSKTDRLLGIFQRVGQYYNLPFLRSLLKQPLRLDDERKVYSSSLISINIHESYQKEYLGDINERTFKIPLAGGFEIVDNVPSLKKYFDIGKELIVANNKSDWFEKIDFYIKNPQKREAIIEFGRKRIQKDHTYHSRVRQIKKLYEQIHK